MNAFPWQSWKHVNLIEKWTRADVVCLTLIVMMSTHDWISECQTHYSMTPFFEFFFYIQKHTGTQCCTFLINIISKWLHRFLDDSTMCVLKEGPWKVKQEIIVPSWQTYDAPDLTPVSMRAWIEEGVFIWVQVKSGLWYAQVEFWYVDGQSLISQLQLYIEFYNVLD